MKNVLQTNKWKFIVNIVACLIFLNSYSQSPVQQHDQLNIKGNRITDKNGDTVQLTGMSLFWTQWMGKFYNYDCMAWLKDDWHISVIRAAMGVEAGGYLTDSVTQESYVDTIMDDAIKLGIYVIIDWHQVSATLYTTRAVNFFIRMAKKYGSYPNVIYEPFNEPNGVNWTSLKPYFTTIIDSIRRCDTANLIGCGTPNMVTGC